MRPLLFLAGLAGVAGCASASLDNPVDGRPPDVPIDAPAEIDALTTVTLTQTANTTVAGGRAVACGSESLPYTRDNSWYRVFPLTGLGASGTFQVTQVAFGVESAGPDAQTIEVRIGNYAGTVGDMLDPLQITVLGTVMVTVPAVTTPRLLSAPMAIAVPTTSALIVEIFAADGMPQNFQFYAGATAGAETAPGYLRAPVCAVTAPTSIKTLRAAAGSVIIDVTGTY